MYIVNQSFAGDECIFEFAMCLSCREKMNGQLSEKSRVAMFDFMHDHADMETREQQLGTHAPTYSLGAMFTGNHLIKGPFPILICDDCELKINETISAETRDTWDKFIGEHFPGPPSEAHIPTRPKPVLF